MLKAIVDSIDGLDESVKPFYEEVAVPGPLQGKFKLKVEAVGGFNLEDVAGLKSALETKKTELTAATSALEAFKGLNAQDVRTKLDELARLKKFNPETEADRLAEQKAASAVAELTRKHETEVSGFKSRESQLVSEIERVLVEAEAISAITKHKGEPKLLLGIVRPRVKVEEVDGKWVARVLNENGEQFYANRDGKLQEGTIEDLVIHLKADETFGRAFEGDGRGGTGSNPNRPGGGGRTVTNPWKQESWNTTEQMRLLKNDPQKAAALKAQAGVK